MRSTGRRRSCSRSSRRIPMSRLSLPICATTRDSRAGSKRHTAASTSFCCTIPRTSKPARPVRGAWRAPPGGPRPSGSTVKVLPVLVHGDGSFCGQGVVAETFNMSQTRGYGLGGTLHVILNNQVGSTIWHPRDQRSTLYCADLARAFDAPVVHVNADEPEAVIAAIRVGVEFRQRFHADIVIDHVGYRRHGHWVGDDPTLTRPAMQRRIERHPSVVTLYADALVRRGLLHEEDVTRSKARALERLIAAHPSGVATTPASAAAGQATRETPARGSVRTSMPIDRLRACVERLASKPAGFTPHATVAR